MNEPFEVTLEQFRDFIVDQGFPRRIAWVFREDVTSRKRRICIRWPLPPDNESAVHDRYAVGIRRGLGLRLEVFCLLDDISCCAIWLPEDEVAASYAMVHGIKFSVPNIPLAALSIRNRLLWELVRWRDRRSQSCSYADFLQPRTFQSLREI